MAISKEELDHFYIEVETALYNFALRWTWNPSLAEELVHDAFIRVWRHRDQVEMKTLKGLLYKTVQNLALNERRRAKLLETLPLLSWMFEGKNSSLEVDFIKRENLSQLQAALETLPKDLRETFLMCQFSDMSHDEIGEALGIKAGTVASRKNRALISLKSIVQAPTGSGESHGR